jgi:hypothetical protein
MTNFLRSPLLALALAAVICASPARASTEINWTAFWAGIAAGDHTVKSAITNAITNCGTIGRDQTLVKVYTDNITHGATADTIVWGAAYFNGLSQPSSCPVQICSAAAGCIVDIYGPPTVTTSWADESMRTIYTYPLLWEDRVFSWSTITSAAFEGVRNSVRDVNDQIVYTAPLADRMVFRALMRNSACVLEEVDHNHDGVQDTNCYKYFQHRGGYFTDLYAPHPYDTEAENDTRTTVDLFDRASKNLKVEEQGQTWRADGVKFVPSSNLAIQLPGFKTDDASVALDYICSQAASTSSLRSYFVPTRADREFQSFRTAVAKGDVPHLTIKDCERRYTEWQGQLVCPSLSCGASMTITAERHCQRASTAYGKCDECASLPDPNPVTGMVTKCFAQQVCFGTDCHEGNSGNDCVPGGGKVLMADGSTKTIETVKLGDEIMAFDRKAPLAPLHKAKVTAVSVGEQKRLSILNGVRMTPDHLVLMTRGNRLAAGRLEVGMKMVGISGEPIDVKTIGVETEPSTVYNLQIDHGDGFVIDGVRLLADPQRGK